MEAEQITSSAKQNAGRWAFDPQIVHHFSDGLYAKQATFPAGAVVAKHTHDFSHLSVLAQGKVVVKVAGEEDCFYEAPACIEIKAGKEHAVIAIEEAVWFCIHATDEKDPNRVDEVLFEEG